MPPSVALELTDEGASRQENPSGCEVNRGLKSSGQGHAQYAVSPV